MILSGRIVEIEKEVIQIPYIKQGIKGNEQYKYDNRYTGGNGTYVVGGEYGGTKINFKIFIYDLKRCVTIDLRNEILRCNNMKNISPQLLDFIIQNNKGRKVKIRSINGSLQLQISSLELKYK